MSKGRSSTNRPISFGAPFLHIDKNGCVLIDLHVIPHAARTRFDGLHGAPGQVALKVRLQAQPVDGKANASLLKWLADQLGISRTSLERVRGQTSRRKQLRLSPETAAKADWQQLRQAADTVPNAIK